MELKHKYRAEQVQCDGIRFPSKIEADYYKKLLILKKSGDIIFFLRQVPFHLPGNVKYLADFLEFWKNGDVVFTDVKGMPTPLYITKKKLVESLYPVTINVVTKLR